MIYLCLTPWDFSETHFLLSLTFPHVCLLWLKTFLSVKEVPTLFLPPAPTPAVSCVSPSFQSLFLWKLLVHGVVQVHLVWMAGLWPPVDPSGYTTCHPLLSSNNRDTIFHSFERRQAWHFWTHPACRPGLSSEATLHFCSLHGSAWYTWLQLSSGLCHLHDTC